MSIEHIEKCLKKFVDNQEELMFADDELVNLVLALSSHILENNTCEKIITLPPNGYLSLLDFEKKYIFIARNTLYKYCKDNPRLQ